MVLKNERVTKRVKEKDMNEEASITINGKDLTDCESAIMRMAVETFTIVMAEGIEERDEGVAGALSEPSLSPKSRQRRKSAQRATLSSLF